jgi:hypothetical protein
LSSHRLQGPRPPPPYFHVHAFDSTSEQPLKLSGLQALVKIMRTRVFAEVEAPKLQAEDEFDASARHILGLSASRWHRAARLAGARDQPSLNVDPIP